MNTATKPVKPAVEQRISAPAVMWDLTMILSRGYASHIAKGKTLIGIQKLIYVTTAQTAAELVWEPLPITVPLAKRAFT